MTSKIVGNHKSEIALSFIIIISGLLNLNKAIDIVIDFLWIALFIYCLVRGSNLIYGVIGGSSLFMSQLLLPFTSILLVNVFYVITCVYFICAKQRQNRLLVNSKMFALYLIIATYSIFVLNSYLSKTTQLILVLSSMLLCCELVIRLRNSDNLFVFSKGFVLATISACFYGLIRNNSFIDAADRFVGTSTDPNYFGFYIIISLVLFGVFKSKIKPIPYKLIVGLHIILAILTGSNTALIAITMIFILHVLQSEISPVYKVLYIGSVVSFGIIILFNRLGLGQMLLGVNTNNYYINRFSKTFGYILIGESNLATSGRTDILHNYYDTFNGFGLFEKLFGGHVCGAFGVSGDFGDSGINILPHSFNVDVIYSIGIVGFIFVYYLIINSFKYWFRIRMSDIGRRMILLKCIVLLYTFSLSFFLGFPSMLFVFI